MKVKLTPQLRAELKQKMERHAWDIHAAATQVLSAINALADRDGYEPAEGTIELRESPSHWMPRCEMTLPLRRIRHPRIELVIELPRICVEARYECLKDPLTRRDIYPDIYGCANHQDGPGVVAIIDCAIVRLKGIATHSIDHDIKGLRKRLAEIEGDNP